MSNTSLRVAIIGAGPSGFYALEHLLKKQPGVRIDLFDRLPTPYGLVRGGVAPDHQKIKSVSKVYDRLAAQPGVRFLGNVLLGRDVTRDELLGHYHAVIYATGAQTDRALGIPGEHLEGSHAATEFVGWYNGHPDFRDHQFDLDQAAAAVIGMGNVAVDVVRILARTEAELVGTDIADYALEALAKSRVTTIYMLGRRGPVQAAFTNPEVKELGEMEVADIVVRPDELELDPTSAAVLASGEDRTPERNIQTLRTFASRPLDGKARQIRVRFLVSPVELIGDGRVKAIRVVKNRLVAGSKGDIRAEPTGETEDIPVGLVFRSVGYLGVALPGVPFDQKRGVVPNSLGRVTGPDGAAVSGEYVVGWIKRGPSGVIGTNKPDSVETVDALLEDVVAGRLTEPAGADCGIDPVLAGRGVQVVTWADWQRLDARERELGQKAGRPRIKLCRIPDMLDAIKPA
jgi:ferredoxin/flavodoxin---NADP+ reductase